MCWIWPVIDVRVPSAPHACEGCMIFDIEPLVQLSRVLIAIDLLVARCSTCSHTNTVPLLYARCRIHDHKMAQSVMCDLGRCMLKDRALHRGQFVHLVNACFLCD